MVPQGARFADFERAVNLSINFFTPEFSDENVENSVKGLTFRNRISRLT